MSQALVKNRRSRASLRAEPDPRTVLLRMALDKDRADRIRGLKDSRPDLTWAQIADAVGVKERSAIDWQKTGGISHSNAQKLASLFNVDEDWLWSGARHGTPDLMGSLRGDTAQLDRMERKLDAILAATRPADPADEYADLYLELARAEGHPAPGRSRRRRAS